MATITAGGNQTSSVTAALTVTQGSPYTAGNEVGALIQFQGATGVQSTLAASGILASIYLSCLSVQTAGFKLYLFNQKPTNTTWADKTTPSIAAADIPFLIGVYALSSADSGLGTHTIYNLDGIGKDFSIPQSGPPPINTQLWGILVTTGTPTFNSAADVSVTINVLKD